MKWFRSRALLGLLTAALLLGGLAARGELREWVRFVEGDSDLRQVFFKTVSLPSGDVLTPRPARETVEALGRLIRTTPAEADLYALRAREAERQLEFEAAETDWKKFTELSQDPAEGQLALADFYQRRLRPQDEVAALLAVGRSPTPAKERFFPARQQRSWRVFERSLAVIEAQALPGETTALQYSAWLRRYPEQQVLYSRFLDVLVGQNRIGDAEDLIDRYANVFPTDPLFAVQARAKLAELASGEDALAVYDEAFQPLWPQGMISEYFGLVAKTRQLRGFLDRAKATLSSNPEDLKATAWIYHYYQRQRNSAAANAALSSFRRNKENRGLRWQADELLTLAKLSQRANNYNEAARYHYALYSLPTATPEDAEQALAGLIDLLLTAPEQPIEFGSGDLSLYRDIATMDDHPGFLNGVLSLLFNSERPRQEFARQERTSVAYFHRARASELLDLFHSRFSYSQLRPALQVKLIAAYNTYGEGDGVIRAAKAFLEEFTESRQRSRVALLMADAYARQEQVNLEFAAYDSLLRELAGQADSVPIGTPELTGALRSSPPGMTAAARGAWLRNQARYRRGRGTTPARSPEYARVLDRYIARLVSLRRGSDALALYDQAAPYWNRMAEVEPGKPEGYLEAATVFWDYYQFDDALRLLDLGRNKLGNPALFAYEVGAIHENQRDYEAAIDEYVRGSLAPQGDAGARRRLLRIARRAAHRDRIDQATAALVSGATPEAAALALRVGVLDVLRRHDDLAALLTRLAAQTTSLELLDQVSTLAVNHRVEDVRVKVVQKQIELTSDPVEKMRLRLALMRLYEGQNDLDSARGVIDALHAEQPKILGVIRGAVDFHWRAKNYDRGLEVLLEAAAASYPDLQTKFRFEAVRKATGIERYEFAREHLRPLLEQKPFDAQYLAAMAVTYGSEGRYDALRDFYVQKIEALLEADLPAEAKKARIAALRRGVIPALTELGDFSAAVDQYIEIINRYPDDEQLIQEAALYAGPRGRRRQLVDYYVRTTAESPKDFRYHRVLARVQTHFENYDAAIRAFTRAAEVRPDDTGVLASRAALEERLMRFDDALRGYQRLYELTYENPRWMEKIAEIQVRQGRSGDAVASLEKALIEGRPERPENYFAVARRLEEWNLSAQAVPFAGTGVKLAGAYLYRESAYVQGTRLYARLMTRARRHEEAYEHLQEEWEHSGRNSWRSRFVSAIGEIGGTVDRYYTPEEQSTFAAFLLHAKSELNANEFEAVLIPLAQSAGLAGLEVQWRHERMLANPGRGQASVHERRLIELQQKRLKHDELGNQLEAYWNVYPRNSSRAYLLDRAAEAYQAAGNEDDEFRVRQRRGANSERYLELLLKRQPDRLIALAASGGGSRVDNRAANYAVARGGVDLALRAVAARGRRLPPVWTKAYRGLVGLHYSRLAPEIDDAFAEILDSGAISQRIGQPLDRDQELAGDLWYYYGARYGEYLLLDGRPEAEDYLPSLLEGASARVSAYSDLANYYREEGAYDDALADYRHVLELQPGNVEAHHSIAGVLWSQGKRDEAIAEWTTALEAYTDQVQLGRLAPTFWDAVPAIIETIGQHDLMPSLEESVIKLLRAYVSRNGSYRVSPLLQAFVESSPNRQAALGSVLEFESEANDRVGYLEVLANAAWVPADQLETVLARVVEAAQQHASRAQGQAIFVARQAVDKWRVRWIEHLIETQQTAKAGEAMEILLEDLAPSLRLAHAPLTIRVAAGNGVLEELLSRYRRQPREAPALQHLQTAAKELRDNGDPDSARRLLDFAYSRQLERRDLSAANFLGLAELRFEQERAEDALALLRRLTLVSGEPFEQFVPVAALLAKAGRHSDAAEFLSERVETVPWDVPARLKLAEARIASDETPEASARALTETASSNGAEYESRVAAAKLLRRIGANPRDLGSEELDVLASDVAPASQAFRDYDYHSRLAASEREASARNTDSQLQLLRDALAIRPEAIKPRVAAFRAARQTADHTLALAALMPLINQTGLGQQLFKQDSVFSETRNQDKLQPWMADQFLSRNGLDNRERATIARELGDSAEILGRLDAASLHFQLALKMDLPPDARQEVTEALERVEAERSLRMDNAKRRPVVTKNLEQDRAVRPRLSTVAGGGSR